MLGGVAEADAMQRLGILSGALWTGQDSDLVVAHRSICSLIGREQRRCHRTVHLARTTELAPVVCKRKGHRRSM